MVVHHDATGEYRPDRADRRSPAVWRELPLRLADGMAPGDDILQCNVGFELSRTVSVGICQVATTSAARRSRHQISIATRIRVHDPGSPAVAPAITPAHDIPTEGVRRELARTSLGVGRNTTLSVKALQFASVDYQPRSPPLTQRCAICPSA
jgi:hypothetical protein